MTEFNPPNLGYASLDQLREHAVSIQASKDDVSSRRLATQTFRSPIRAMRPETIEVFNEMLPEPAIKEDPEVGTLVNVGLMKALIESGKLSERRESEYSWSTRKLPAVLGTKGLGLWTSFIDEREKSLDESPEEAQ